MNRRILRYITASVLIFGVVLPNENTAAQTTAKDLVGTWTLVSITIERDGKKIDFYGPNPQGQAMFDANGRVSSIITVRIFPNSRPITASRELQKKTRPSCRGASLTSAPSRSMRWRRP
jgi:hypothetical protein